MGKTSPFFAIGAGILVLGAAVALPRPVLAQKAAPAAAKQDDAFKLGVQAYIYGYPHVLMSVTGRVSINVPAPDERHAPVNQFAHLRELPSPTIRDVVSPNAEMLSSVAWLDLAQGPIVLHLPDSHGHYYQMPMLDAWTNVFASPGSRTTGTKESKFIIIGPNWNGSLPRDRDIILIHAPTNAVWIAGRTYCSGTRADLDAVHDFQNGISLTPLSAYGASYSPPKTVPVDPYIDMKTPPLEQVAALDARTFFGMLAASMKANPPSREDAAFLARLARIGIVPGQDFDASRLDPAVLAALDRAVRVAQAEIKKGVVAAGSRLVNGWSYSTSLGDYGTRYLLRAYVARTGIGANLAKDTVYPAADTDSSGRSLNGSNRYLLHFEKSQIPPVNALWSLTLYDDHHAFVSNPIQRYALRSTDKLSRNPDGSLDLYIQTDPPPRRQQANWLPAPPDRDFNLILRLYWPRQQVLTGQWKPAPVLRMETRLGSISQESTEG